MKESTKLPKTFLILAKTKNGKSGYVRFRSYFTEDGNVEYRMYLVGKVSEASKYVTLDNSKVKAKELKTKYGFAEVQVIDELSKKVYVIH